MGSKNFQSLTEAVTPHRNKTFRQIPKALKLQFSDAVGMDWDSLTPEQRLTAANTWDAQHDPAMYDLQEAYFNVAVVRFKVEKQLAELESTGAPSITERNEINIAAGRLRAQLAELSEVESELRQSEHDAGLTRVIGIAHIKSLRETFIEIPVEDRDVDSICDNPIPPINIDISDFYLKLYRRRNALSSYLERNEKNLAGSSSRSTYIATKKLIENAMGGRPYTSICHPLNSKTNENHNIEAAPKRGAGLVTTDSNAARPRFILPNKCDDAARLICRVGNEFIASHNRAPAWSELKVAVCKVVDDGFYSARDLGSSGVEICGDRVISNKLFRERYGRYLKT